MTEQDLPLRLMMNITTPEQLEDWLLVEKTLGPRLPKPNASGTLSVCIGDRAKHIREKDAKGTTMRELLDRVNALVELLEEQHGVTLGVTVRPPKDADYKGCDNAPE